MNLRVRRVLIVVLLLFTSVTVAPPALDAWQKVHVKGYTKKDGTKVKPHDRNAPKSGSSTYKAPKASKAPKVSPASPPAGRSDRCDNCDRDEHGRILRRGKAKKAFMRSTGYDHGRPGYVIDHIQPLACGGQDIPSNMQWQTAADARAKDGTERAACR
jgi:hypothetical protein